MADGQIQYLPCMGLVLRDIEVTIANIPEQYRRIYDSQVHHRNRLGRELWTDVPAFLAVSYDLVHLTKVLANNAAHPRFSLRVAVKLLRKHHPRNALVVTQKPDVAAKQKTQTFQRIVSRLANGLDMCQQPVAYQVEHRVKHVVHAAVVTINP